MCSIANSKCGRSLLETSVILPGALAEATRTSLPQFRTQPIEPNEVIAQDHSRIACMVNLHRDRPPPATFLNNAHHLELAVPLGQINSISGHCGDVERQHIRFDFL